MDQTIFIIIIIILIFTLVQKKEGFTDPLTEKRKTDIISNKELFSPSSTYKKAKKKLPWMDPVYYHDLTILHKNRQLNSKKVKDIL